VGGLRFVKGHGTGNDFLVFPDAAAVALGPAEVAAICDRHRGIGADGVLVVVPTGAEPAFFMDYRNADGSVAEMCGNGVRVFARYLVDGGLVPPGRLQVATRSGSRTLVVPESGDISVDMGVPAPLHPAVVEAAGGRWPAVGIGFGNPHLVVRVDDVAEAGALSQPPIVHPEPGSDGYPDGVNVEFVAVRGQGELAIRVHERGVGETRSCGTGACAAAAAARAWQEAAAARYTVHAPGGELRVDFRDDGCAWLTGPAVLVAEGELRDDWQPVSAG
jgi:diaminopimelate epimerase